MNHIDWVKSHTFVVAFVVGLESTEVSLAQNPHNLLNLIILCGLESPTINIIKEAYNKCYLLCVPSMGI